MSNLTCHWCRRSKNKPSSKYVKYVSCEICKKSYCKNCFDKDWNIIPDEHGCLFCKKLCCCVTNCQEDHKCCHNTYRTIRRRGDVVRRAIIVEL